MPNNNSPFGVTEVKTDVLVETPRQIDSSFPFFDQPITREIKYKPTFDDFKRMRDIERESMKPTFDVTMPFWFKKFFFGEKIPTNTRTPHWANLFEKPTMMDKLNGKRLSMMIRPESTTEEEDQLKTLFFNLFIEKAKLNDQFKDFSKFKTIYTPKDIDFEMLKNLPLFESLDKMKYTNIKDIKDKKFEENLEKLKEILSKEKVDFSDLMKVAPFLEKTFTKMTPLEKMEKMVKKTVFPTEEVVY